MCQGFRRKLWNLLKFVKLFLIKSKSWFQTVDDTPVLLSKFQTQTWESPSFCQAFLDLKQVMIPELKTFQFLSFSFIHIKKQSVEIYEIFVYILFFKNILHLKKSKKRRNILKRTQRLSAKGSKKTPYLWRRNS